MFKRDVKSNVQKKSVLKDNRMLKLRWFEIEATRDLVFQGGGEYIRFSFLVKNRDKELDAREAQRLNIPERFSLVVSCE